MGVGTVLGQLLEEHDKNANEFAREIGVCPQTLYSMIKRDSSKADLEIIYLICEALEVDVSIFFEEYREENKISNLELTASERKLLKAYRELCQQDQDRVSDFAYALKVTIDPSLKKDPKIISMDHILQKDRKNQEDEEV